MSVLIKGMEMPENCLDCILSGDFFCKGKPLNFTGYIDEDKRPDWCPLVNIPATHGRLIDVDKLKADYRMADECDKCETEWKSCQYDYIYSKMDFCGWLDDAGTVIEAEGE